MNIGIDIDGFLTDIYSFQINNGNKYFKSLYNPYGYKIKDMYNCTNGKEIGFWIRNIKYYLERPRYMASEFIKMIKDNGNKVYIITARAYTNKKNIIGFLMRHYVKKWLKKNNIVYDEIIFSGEDKLDIIRKYNIKIMCEDNPNYASKLNDYVKVILMMAPYNYHVRGKNIYKVKDFNNAIKVFRSISD